MNWGGGGGGFEGFQDLKGGLIEITKTKEIYFLYFQMVFP